ncbi:MAG: glycolate oxidase subunit GlcE [Pseudomonadota bacterium]
MDAVLEQFKARIAAATAAEAPLCLRGGGTRSWYGQAEGGDPLDTSAYSGVVAYEPSELYISARCGTLVSEIERVLDQRGQMLAFEPPRFGPGSTVGGMLACGMGGPRRASAGAMRDFVLGASLLDGRGQELHFGGRVMKNVAGYDVSRMLAGSLGTLGIILDATFKVVPKPLCEVSLEFSVDQQEALAICLGLARNAVPVSASCWFDGKLTLRVSGAEPAVRLALSTLGGAAVVDADAFWRSLRDQRHAFFDQAAPLWRLSLPPATPVLDLEGVQLVEWGGAQRWVHAADDGAHMRECAARAGGHATLFRGGDKRVGVFQPLPPALSRIHGRLKQVFDPHAIFNPGRMYKET